MVRQYKKERKIWNKSDSSILGELLIIIAAVFIFFGVNKFIEYYIPNVGWLGYIFIGFFLVILGIFMNHNKLDGNIKRKLKRNVKNGNL